MPIRRILIACSFLALLLLASGEPSHAQGKTVEVPRRDIDITIEKNGDVRFKETWPVTFVGGPFRFAFRGITLNKVRAIDSFQVSEGDLLYQPSGRQSPNTYEVYQESGQQFVRWYFPDSSDQTRTFTLQYTLRGAMRYANQGDELYWKVIEPERQYAIPEATVTVHLPDSFQTSRISAQVTSRNGQAFVQDGQTVVFSGTGINPGIEMEIRLVFPHGAIADPAAVFNLAFLFLAMIVLLAGGLGLYLLWFVKGRDVPVPAAASIKAPPDDLPPGLMGTLIDEHADLKDIMATIIDLARRGVLRITETDSTGHGAGSPCYYSLERVGDAENLRPYERMLIETIFKGDRERDLAEIKGEFYPTLPAVQWQMYDEVTQLGFFSRNPRTTRIRYALFGIGALIASAVVGYALWKLFLPYGELGYLPGLALGVVAVSLVWSSRHMPHRTRKGATVKAKCEAFRQYLTDIDKFTQLKRSKELFDKYLPYAVCFGLEKSWVRKFEQVGTPAPKWYDIYLPVESIGFGDSSGTTSDSGGGHTPSFDRVPSLNQAAGGAFRSLNSMSDNLFSMLKSTAFVLGCPPGVDGSGGGDGGGGGGWSIGGGGGGGSSGFG